MVVLVSSDSDFAPLVIRLRETGCRVCGIGQQGKTGDETMAVYDAFTDLAHHGARSESARSAPARRSAAAPVTATTAAPASAPAKTPRTRAAPAKKAASAAAPPAAKKTARKTTKSAKAPAPRAPVASEAAEFILQAVPGLRGGGDVALNDAAQALRAAGLLGKHGSSLKLFDKLTDEFAVLQQPDRIRWLGAAAP